MMSEITKRFFAVYGSQHQMYSLIQKQADSYLFAVIRSDLTPSNNEHKVRNLRTVCRFIRISNFYPWRQPSPGGLCFSGITTSTGSLDPWVLIRVNRGLVVTSQPLQ